MTLNTPGRVYVCPDNEPHTTTRAPAHNTTTDMTTTTHKSYLHRNPATVARRAILANLIDAMNPGDTIALDVADWHGDISPLWFVNVWGPNGCAVTPRNLGTNRLFVEQPDGAYRLLSEDEARVYRQHDDLLNTWDLPIPDMGF